MGSCWTSPSAWPAPTRSGPGCVTRVPSGLWLPRWSFSAASPSGGAPINPAPLRSCWWARVLAVFILTTLAAGTPASSWLVAALFLPLPIAGAAALLRGEFLDARATLNRALVFVVTTVLLLGVYAGIVALIGALANSTGI